MRITSAPYRPVTRRAGWKSLSLGLFLLAPAASFGTGLATCDSGPESGWKPQADLEKQLTAKGWKVNRIKIDGGCYEVYAIDADGKRVEAYFHPVTLEAVPTQEH